MNQIRSILSIAVLSALASAAAGCEVTAKSTERYEGAPTTAEAAWSTGMDLHIDARNGIINVEVGEPGVVTARFEPFTYRGYDEEAEAEAEMTESLTKSAAVEGDMVVVKTLKQGSGSSSLGADITVFLPPEFDAGLFIDQGNGDVDVNNVGQAIQVTIQNAGVGDCVVTGAPTVTRTEVWCNAVLVENVSDYVNVQADGLNGNASVSLVGISGAMPAGVDRCVVYTEDGDIVLDLPSADGFVVQATTADGNGVNEGPVPSTCSSAVAADNSKTVTCGAGPLFDVQAALGDTGDGNIELRYH